jgi:nicotinamidase-related amidase
MAAAAQLSLHPSRSALLSMDFQAGIVYVYGNDPDLTSRAARVIASARNFGMRIIHVKVGFRPKLPEVSVRNRFFGAIKTSPQHQRLFEGEAGAIHPAVAPEADDIVITKTRVNAFVGTDLDLVLRANEIDTLVLFGIATSGVVLSTLLHASDADYRLVVINDCCADLDNDLQACLFDKLFSIMGLRTFHSGISRILRKVNCRVIASARKRLLESGTKTHSLRLPAAYT